MIIRQLAQNRPLGGFLTEFHLIGRARSCSKNGKRSSIALKPLSPQRQPSGSRVPQIAPPHGQAYFGTRRAMHKGKMGDSFAQRQVASNEKAPFVRTRNKDWSGQRGSNPRPPPWQVVLYQLSHVRIYKWWAIQDLNL